MPGDNFKKVLTSADGLEITFLVDDGDARVDFRSDQSMYPLDNVDDIIVFVNGENIAVETDGSGSAIARLGAWDRFGDRPISLMIRVDEYFEGWELD